MFATNDPRYFTATALERYQPPVGSLEHVFKIIMTEHLYNQHRALWRDCFFPGHFTASAWVVNAARTKVLLLHHGKLNRWMQPGGHADGDGVLHRVAARECHEETGLTAAQFAPLGDMIYDLDIHYIPQAMKNSVKEPGHLHLDVRFAFEADESVPLNSPEGLQLRWVPLEEARTLLAQDASCLRLIEKVETFLKVE